MPTWFSLVSWPPTSSLVSKPVVCCEQAAQCKHTSSWLAAAPGRRAHPFRGRPHAARCRSVTRYTPLRAIADPQINKASASALDEQATQLPVLRRNPDSPCNPAAAIVTLARQAATTAAAALLSAVMLSSPAPVQAADTAKVGTCLLGSCQKELALCLADAKCVKNLICLQTCNGRPDETDCQVNAR